jgi:predicted PurR-regulated permease PerM
MTSGPASGPDGPDQGEAPGDIEHIRALGDRLDVRTVALVGLFVLATLYTLRLARPFILPIVFALLLDFLLTPAVRWLRRLRVPEPVGAALVLLALVGAIGGIGYYLAAPAASWVQRAPETMTTARERLAVLRRPVEQVTRAAEQVQSATDVDGGKAQQVEIAGPSLTRQAFGGTMNVLGFVSIAGFLTYFLLAAGDLFLQKLIRVLPQFRDKKRAVSIAREIEEQVSVHILTTTAINAGVGILTGIAMWLLGMPNPALWGLVAGLLNYMPYVGAFATIAVLGTAALVSFDTLGQALLVPGAYFVINLIEANIVTPLVLGNRLRLNTVALFIGMMFWWYVWGIPGALMAVPMMATIKIFCDHFEDLAPVGEFLGK